MSRRATQKTKKNTGKRSLPRRRQDEALREAPLCGTGRDAVSFQSRTQIHPRARQSRQSRKQSAHLLFSGINGIPGCCHRAANTEKSLEQLRLSPCCCCYLASRCVRIPCIIDGSGQIVRECRQMPSASLTGRDRSVRFKKKNGGGGGGGGSFFKISDD